MMGNIGRTLPFKKAFAEHFLRGLDSVKPVTDEMRRWLERPREQWAVVAQERMIDDVEKLLKKYQYASKGSDQGIHSPVPVVMIAFAKDAQPVSPDRNRALPNPEFAQLEEGGEWYLMRSDFVEQRVQIAFFAHTPETARAMTSQMRLYFQRFLMYHFPVSWSFGGYDFDLTATIQEIPASDDLADLADRTNLTVLTWNFTIEYQIPYLDAPDVSVLTDDGLHIKGYPVVDDVELIKRI